ncbi:DppA [Thermococcus onnurineus NA1]|uniref:DppA n=1 Tax=Thermococcus onnurineus (strain NA1) TaxID=523850 RepID=B6YV00_THEON|nr:hypothetical protein [Thermococcus onnurineus]ACJ17228.1 DppA [Thermococcus onnurineus NA1]
MRVKTLLFLLLIALAVIASGCTGGGTKANTSNSQDKPTDSGSGEIGSTTILLIVTNDEIHNAYLTVRDNADILVVPEQYSVGLEIKGDKASITQKELWAFWIEPNNVVRVEKLESSEGFTFKAKEIHGDNLVSETFGVKKIPDEYRKLLNGLPSFESLDKMPSDFGVARKVPLSELAKGITIDEVINGYPKLNDSEKFEELYRVFTLQSGGTGSSDTLYTGEVIPILRAKLWNEIELQGALNNAVVGGPPKQQRFAVVAIPTNVLSGDVDISLNYDPNTQKGTIKVTGLKTTDGYVIVVTLG